jgi:hypothetical protein
MPSAPEASAAAAIPARWLRVAWAACLVLWAARWPSFPVSLDPAYHLMVARQVQAAGGPIAVETWQGAPDGRPHLYPPALHVLLAGLGSLGLPPVTGLRLLSAAVMPVLLAALFATARRLLGPLPALASALMALASVGWWLQLTGTMASTLALLALLGWLVALAGGRWVAAGCWLALAWYTHLGVPWMLVAASLMAIAALPSCRAAAARGLGLGVVLASPWLWHLARHAGEVRVVGRLENQAVLVAPILWIFAAIGLVAAWRKGSGGRLLAAVAPASALMAPVFAARWLGGEGLLPAVLLAGTGVVAAAGWRGWPTRIPTIARVAALAAMTWIAPQARLEAGRWRWQPPASLPIQWIIGAPASEFEPMSLDGPHARRLAELVARHSRPGEILWSNAPYAGGFVAALAGRATSSAMFYEVPPRLADPIAAAHLVLWWPIDPLPGMPALEAVRGRYRLEPVARTEAAVLFRQPGERPLARDPRRAIPLAAAAVLLWGVLGVACLDMARRPAVAAAPPARGKDRSWGK